MEIEDTRRRRNQLKILALKALSHGPVTSSQLADYLQIGLHNAQTVLLRIYRQTCCTREKLPSNYRWKPFLYTINARGEQRLAWLERSNK